MIGIVIYDNLIAVPVPIVDEAVIDRGYPEIESAKPEPLPVAASKMEDVPTADAAGKSSMLPWMVHVITSVVAACLMSNPLIVIVDVRSLRMSTLVR
jgi:hypothetical protein